MNMFMTRRTDWYNIKLVNFVISSWMMVMLCLFSAIVAGTAFYLFKCVYFYCPIIVKKYLGKILWQM